MPPWEKYAASQPQASGPWAKYSAPKAETAQQRADKDAATRLKSNPDWLRSITQGATFGFADELDAAGAAGTTAVNNALRKVTGKPDVGYGAKEAYDAVLRANRQGDKKFAQERPVTNLALQVAGGSWLPVAKAKNVLEAGMMGAGIGAVSGAGNAEGDLADRAKGAALGGAIGFGTGAVTQKVGNALSNAAQRAKAAAPSAARQLAQEGVQLTPGQMMGGTAQRIEDAATSIPIVGDAIRNRRIEGIESFNKAAINRVLAPLGENLPEGVNVGREGVEAASQAVSNAYKRALAPVAVAADPDFVMKAGSIKQSSNLSPELAAEYDNILKNTIAPALGKQISGEQWKAIDADLGAAARAAQNASGQQPSAVYLSRALNDLKNEWRGLLNRYAPEASQAVSMADEANANLVRIRQAAQMNGAEGGVFTPAQLSNAVRASDSSAGNRQFATGNALMQDLTDRARSVLPSRVPDSGTAIRSTVNALGLTGGGVALGLSPGAAATAIGTTGAGALLYSRPVQGIINAAYRASTPGAVRAAVADLQQLAARNPGLQAEVDRAIAELVSARTDRPQGQAQAIQ